MKKQVALIVLDGWGYRKNSDHNAIAKAKTPFFDYLWNNFPHSLLEASGEFVGLPKGQIGNSEIGHTTIGAGKIIDTDLVRINKAINKNELESNPVLSEMFKHVKSHNSKLHAVGLIGNGGVHSHQDHLLAFVKLCAKNDIKNLALHLITDGRDAGPNESIESIKEIIKVLKKNKIGRIASISGRYYSMDRDNNWDRLDKFTDFFLEQKIEKIKISPDWKQEILDQHELGRSDEHLEPFVLDGKDGDYLTKDDAVFFFNYRSDRARMLSAKIIEKAQNLNLYFATLTEYNPEFNAKVVFPPIHIETTLAKEISNAGLSQAHIAETEKFPHATYFLNGGKQDTYANEEHIMLPSNKKVKTHDEAPEMMAKEIADEAIKKISENVDFIFINFANADMVGHSANETAIIKAVEFVDQQLQKIVEKLHQNGGTAFITADHGNAELNYDVEKNENHTAHTTNKVPAIYTNKEAALKNGSLADVAPTILEVLNLEKPKSMSGVCLLTFSK